MTQIFYPTVTRFELGRIYVTPGARYAHRMDDLDLNELLERHAAGDWSDMSPEDAEANTAAITDSTRIFSAFVTDFGRMWVITEADRSSTTILCPEEY